MSSEGNSKITMANSLSGSHVIISETKSNTSVSLYTVGSKSEDIL